MTVKEVQELIETWTAKNKVRLLPPLVITDGELDRGIAILKQALKEAAQ